MSILDTIKGWKSALQKEVRVFNAGDTTPEKNLALLYNWFWTAKLGMPRKVDIIELRQYEKSCWVQMVINAIQKQLMIIDWDVVPKDEEEDVEKYKENIEKTKTLLETPNRNGITFWELWGPFTRDVLVIDAGVIVKGRNASGELVELFSHDGSKFLADIDPYGIINGWYQYSFRYPRNQPMFFNREDIVYGRVNTNTEMYPYGFSPLQSILQETELLIQSTRWNKEYYKNNAIPDGIVQLPMEKTQMDRFRTEWYQNIKGKAHKLLFHNSEGIDFKKLGDTNKDMEWLEGQKWYFHLVFGAYGLSPQEVGFYENSNRSTGESQERITIKNAIKPYLQLIEDKINRDIIPDLIGNDDIKFTWKTKDDVAEKIEAEQIMAKLNANVYTINEVRAMEGKEQVEWGDKPMSMVMQEKNAEMLGEEQNQSEQNALNPKDRDNSKDKAEAKKDDKERDDKLKDTKSSKSYEIVVKESDIDAGEDMIEEADEYDDFLSGKFKKWEGLVLSAVDKALQDEVVQKDYVKKTFPDFLRRLFNIVNTLDFRKELTRIIRIKTKQGIQETEEELQVDIGFGPQFDKEVNTEVGRQLDGFMIDGKRWAGLKGVSEDLQNSISKIVADGVSDRKGLKEIKNEIKGKFSQYTGDDTTEGRAMKIARTESNRILNYGKLKAFRDSGLDGYKVWESQLDERTSGVCKELHGQKKKMHENFVSKVGEFFQPPAHPNCRSIIKFELEEK